mmetsp:Transcript_9961/g.15980  ORF Transcript_9961/g.15980 Transcript_9961/m.15980 type:complete len:513 (+) Transcript_9961:192-1730(+)
MGCKKAKKKHLSHAMRKLVLVFVILLVCGMYFGMLQFRLSQNIQVVASPSIKQQVLSQTRSYPEVDKAVASPPLKQQVDKQTSKDLESETKYHRCHAHSKLVDARMEVVKKMPKLFATLNMSVTPEDQQIGHTWATYVQPLPNQFHIDQFHRVDRGCFLSPCATNPYGTFNDVDHGAEAIILAKLFSSLRFVESAEEADIILVPALPVIAGMQVKGHPRCRILGQTCRNQWFKDLAKQVDFKRPKLHLLVASQDVCMNHQLVKQLAMGKLGNAIVVNFGPRYVPDGEKHGIIVPPLNGDKDLVGTKSPSFMSKGPYERSIFLVANFDDHRGTLEDRLLIRKRLKDYKGPRHIITDMFDIKGTVAIPFIPDATFTLCPPGDLPYQKRIYDAISYGSIPVVIERKVENTSLPTWYRANRVWKFCHAVATSVENSYPDISFSGLSYSDVVVALSPEQAREDVVGSLETVLKDREGILRRFEAIRRIRQYISYDFSGTRPDAFTAMLHKLRAMICS